MLHKRAVAAAILAAVILAGGCADGQLPADANPLSVSASPFALADVVSRVGLNRVTVAAAGGFIVRISGTPWLDPVAMETVTDQVASQLSTEDPAGRAAYQSAARVYVAQLGALDIDFRSTRADCGRQDIVTADGAFGLLAARYGFVDHTATDPGIAQLIASKGIPVVFTETGVGTTVVEALGVATHTKVQQLDTTTVLTALEATRGSTYLSLMTDNLAKLSSALDCTSNSP
jgi:ABC-type Zn uptake system ZnuABC Zn-binding protein ZnuA